MATDLKPSLQDYSLIKAHVINLTNEINLSNPSFGFCFFALELILNLQSDEAEDAITDNAYLTSVGSSGGHDRGIDAVIIDESDSPATIHLFNFKYTGLFKNLDNHFPGCEIDKICGFISSIMQQDENLEETVNPILFQKSQDIWALFERQNPKFVIHICSNTYNGFEIKEKNRFEQDLRKYSDVNIEYHLMPEFVERITRKGKQKVHAKIRVINQNHFEKSDGDIRALIADIDVRDLLRIVIDHEDLRQAADPDDYSLIMESEILEDAFEDNVRVYLRQRSKINRNIKETAKSEDSHRLFYYNNGITITCSSFSYPSNRRSPIVELENLQIVNGSQTIHALYEAFKESPDNFNDMDILCRIYETKNKELSTDIAEYTNSQNPVKSRDIRSNDYTQKKLESELSSMGYYYERKRNQYHNELKEKRIDAEKAGQAVMAFFNKLPSEAKDKKRQIFAEKYDEVFSDDITADSILVSIKLYQYIEEQKMTCKKIILSDPKLFEENSFILHSTYYILFTISELADKYELQKTESELESLKSLYLNAKTIVNNAVISENKKLEDYAENYSHRSFFKGNSPRKYIEQSVHEI